MSKKTPLILRVKLPLNFPLFIANTKHWIFCAESLGGKNLSTRKLQCRWGSQPSRRCISTPMFSIQILLSWICFWWSRIQLHYDFEKVKKRNQRQINATDNYSFIVLNWFKITLKLIHLTLGFGQRNTKFSWPAQNKCHQSGIQLDLPSWNERESIAN